MALCGAEVTRTTGGVFMVEQNASLALQIGDYGYVLHSEVLMRDPRIRDAYLGGETTMAS
jgi:ABC-type branched-subunit amino acid transport system ATPase component